MSDFLNFLNTASLDALVKAPGVTRQIAGNIIAARPFDTIDDCLKVRGMGKGLLNRLQTAFETQRNDTESLAILPVDEDAGAPIEKKGPDEENDGDQKPSFFARIGRAFLNILVAIVRLILTVVAVVVVGAVFYFGIPFFNENLLQPIQRNTDNIDSMEKDIADLQVQLGDLSARVDAIETSIEAHTASIEQLEKMQNDLEAQLQGNQDRVLLKLKNEIMFTRALDILGRGRLYLAQSNFGLAKNDVQDARNLLAQLQVEQHDDAIAQAIGRLDLALGNLPQFPVVAAGDLEIAWQLLMTGTPVNIATETPTPAPIPTLTPNTDSATATPTAFPTSSIDVTSTP